MPNDNIRKVYDALAAKYNKMAQPYEEFEQMMTDENNRKKVYDALSQKYSKMAQSWDEFNSMLTPAAPEPQAQPVQQAKVDAAPEQKEGGNPAVMPEAQAEQSPVDEARIDTAAQIMANSSGYTPRSAVPRTKEEWDTINQKAAELKRKEKGESRISDELTAKAEEAQKETAASKFVNWLRAIGPEIAETAGPRPVTLDEAQQFQENAQEYRLNKLVSETLDEALDVKNAVENGGSVGQGFVDMGTRVSTWDFGYSDIVKGLTLQNLVEKYESGEPMSETEERALDMVALATYIMNEYQNDESIGYKVGQSLPQSLGFMASLALNPASGLGASMMKRALQKYGKQGLKALTKRELANVVGKRALGDVLEMGTATVTSGGLRTLGDAIDRINGSAQAELSPEGYITYGGQYDQDQLFHAGLKAFENNFIENWTEAMGEYFKPAGNALSDVLGRLTDKGLRRMKWDGVADWINAIPASQWAKQVKKFKEVAKFNGIVGEILEEEIGMFLEPLIVKDSTLGENFAVWSSVPEIRERARDNQLTTIFACSLMSGTLYGVEAAGARNKLSKDLRQADYQGRNDFGQQWWQGIKETLSNTEPENLVRTMKDIAYDTELTDAQRKDVVEYASKLIQTQQFNTVSEKAKQEMDEVSKTLTAAYDAGYRMGVQAEPRSMRQVNTALSAAMTDVEALGLLEVADKLSTADAVTREQTLEGLGAEERKAVEYYLGCLKRQQGLYEGVEFDSDSQIDQAIYDMAPAVQTDAEGNRIITSAVTADGREVYVAGGEGAMSVIIDAEGNKVPYPTDQLSEVVSTDATVLEDQLRKAIRDEWMGRLNYYSAHNEQTKEPQIGMAIGDGDETVVITDMGEGWVTLQQAKVDDEGNIVADANGTSRDVTKEYVLALQDEIYDRRDAMDGKVSVDEAAKVELEDLTPQIQQRAEQWASVTGQPVRLIGSVDEIDNPQALAAVQAGKNITGWFNDATGEVCFYVPNITDMAEVDRTYIHEVVGHKGMRMLLGERGYNELCMRVWNDLMTDEDKAQYLSKVEHLQGDEATLQIAAADEYIAYFAEQMNLSPDEVTQTVWQKFVEIVKEILTSLGLGNDITTDELGQLLQASLARFQEQNRLEQEHKAQAEAQRQAEEASALNKIPVITDAKTGETIDYEWSKAPDVDTALQAMREAGIDEDVIKGYAADMIKKLSGDIKKLEKPKATASLTTRQSNKAKIQDIDNQIKFWQDIAQAFEAEKQAEQESIDAFGSDYDSVWNAVNNIIDEMDFETQVRFAAAKQQYIWADSPSGTKGFASHMIAARGDKRGERMANIGWLVNRDKGGKYPEEIAEAIYGNLPDALKEGHDTMEVLDIIIETIREANHPATVVRQIYKDIIQSQEEAEQRRLEQEAEEEERYKDAWAKERGFDNYQNYLTFEELQKTGEDIIEIPQDELENYYNTVYGSDADGRLEPGVQAVVQSAAGQEGTDSEGNTLGQGEEATQQGVGIRTGGSEESSDNVLPGTEGAEVKSSIQGLEGYSEDELNAILKRFIEGEMMLSDDNEFKLKDVKIVGSRVKGTAKEDSDLDVLVEYEGSYSEDDVFNMLNGNEDGWHFTIDGIRVDFNPIKADKSGTIEQWIARNGDYDKNAEVRQIPENAVYSVAPRLSAYIDGSGDRIVSVSTSGERGFNLVVDESGVVRNGAEGTYNGFTLEQIFGQEIANKITAAYSVLKGSGEDRFFEENVSYLGRVDNNGLDIILSKPKKDKAQAAVEALEGEGRKEDKKDKKERPLIIGPEPLNKGEKWDKTGEPEKFKAGRKHDSHDSYFKLGNKTYGLTTAEADTIEVLAEEYGSLTALWNAYEAGRVMLDTNEAAAIKAQISYAEKRKEDEYVKAVNSGNVDEAIRLLREKALATPGITAYSAANPYAGQHRDIAKLIKTSASDAVKRAAVDMARFVPDNAVLIPVPPHTGRVEDDSDTIILANAISDITGSPVIAALEGDERKSRYQAKQEGEEGPKAEELGFRKVADIPEGKIPVFVDNVVDSGETAKAAKDAIGGGLMLAYAKGVRSKAVKGLKNMAITYDDNGNLIPLSQRFDAENEDIRFRENQYIHSKKFKDWFGDWENNPAAASKVVDKNGKPLVVYRGADFNPLTQEPGKGVIKPQSYFSADKEYASRYGTSTGAYYLNIRNPFDVRNSADAAVLSKLLPEGYKIPTGNSGALDWAAFSLFDIDDFIESHPEYDGMIFDEGGEFVKDGEVKYFGVSYMPFNGGSQVKSATDNNGEFDINNADTRFREVNDQASLMGSHNITPENLKNILKRGGLANPSMAVVNTDNHIHTNYGEISLIPYANRLDASKYPGVVTYSGDAYTPEYPTIIHQLTAKGEKKLDDMVKSLGKGDRQLENFISSNLYNYADDNGTHLTYEYAATHGLNPEVAYEQPLYSKEDYDRLYAIVGDKSTSSLTKEEKQQVLDILMSEKQQEVDAKIKNAEEKGVGENKPWRTNYLNMLKGEVEDYRKRITDENGEIYFAPLDSYIYDVYKAERLRREPRLDSYRTRDNALQQISEAGLNDDYWKWVGELLNDEEWPEMLFAGRDHEGRRKLVPNTLENASRLMNKAGDANAVDWNGYNATKSLMLKKMRTLSDIRKYKHLLIPEEDYHQQAEKMSKEWAALVGELADMQKNSDNPFSDMDYAENRIQEALLKNNPIAHLNKEYGYNIDKDSDFGKRLMDAIFTMESAPAKYFETKFKRPVYLSEFKTAIIPDDLDDELRRGLQDAGINLVEYKHSDLDDRIEKTRRATEGDSDVRFREANAKTDIFISNAQRAVENIKQEKATPDQWLAMIQKAGGLKAGEDKWLGLSEWLKAQKSEGVKTLTKAEVNAFIEENKIEILEERYSQAAVADYNSALKEYEDEYAAFIEEAEKNGEDDPHEWAFDQMIERYGDVFDLAFMHDGNTISPTENWDMSGYTGAAMYFLEQRLKNNERVINETRLKFTTDALENKREIALWIPDIEPWKEFDNIHFGDAGDGRTIGWIRFGNVEKPNIGGDAYERFEIYRLRKEAIERQIRESQGALDRGVTGKRREAEEVSLKNNKELLSELNEQFADVANLPIGRYLAIDEIQSNRHQEGRKRGYKPFISRKVRQEYDELKKQYMDAAHEFTSFVNMLNAKYGSEAKYIHPEDLFEDDNKAFGRWFAELTDEEREKYNRLDSERTRTSAPYNEMEERLGGGDYSDKVPDAPFDKNWAELCMKRMLRLAAEENYDKLAWTSGDIQKERYDLGRYISVINSTSWEDLSDVFDDEDSDTKRFTDVKEITASIEADIDLDLVVNRDGLILTDVNDRFTGHYLSEVVGEEAAKHLLQDEAQAWTGARLMLGERGMNVFYDEMLPAFMEKYGKQWGVKPELQEIPGLDGKWWAIDVNDAMKESVMQGQVMFRIGDNEQTEKLNDKQKQPGEVHLEVEDTTADDIRFRLSNNNRKAVEAWLKKRTDIDEVERLATLDYINNLSDAKTQLATGWWFAKGTVRLPEDQPKIDQAVKVSEIAKVDPLKYSSPMELINDHLDIELKGERINPDEVSTLHKVKELPEGIVIYDVDESNESRQNMREIINTHFGKECSPWCLLQGDEDGNLTEQSEQYWNYYNAYPKQVAFKDGKLLAFSANADEERLWWDRQDEAAKGIPIEGKIPGDPLGRSGKRIMNVKTGEITTPYGLYKGNRENGVYEEWHDNDQLRARTIYKNGVAEGLIQRWYRNGQKSLEFYRTNSLEDGPYMSWYSNGQVHRKAMYREGFVEGVEEYWYENGKPLKRTVYHDNILAIPYSQRLKRVAPYESWFEGGTKHEYIPFDKSGQLNGTGTTWYENGNIAKEIVYKDDAILSEKTYWQNGNVNTIEEWNEQGKRDGVKERYDAAGKPTYKARFTNGLEDYICSYYPGGQPYLVQNFKNGVRARVEESYWPNGNLEYTRHYDDKGLRQGEEKRFYESGELRYINHWKNNEADGVWEEYDSQGHLVAKTHYKNGQLHGTKEFYSPTGKVLSRWTYENGERIKDEDLWQQQTLFREKRINEAMNILFGDDTQGSLFTPDEMRGVQPEEKPETKSESKAETKEEKAGPKAEDIIKPLRKLEPGEICLVQRKMTEDKNFNFTVGNKIESLDDIAYIFRELEDKSIENAFVVFFGGECKEAVVLHLAMGGISYAAVDLRGVLPVLDAVKPSNVCLVHNHPSGRLVQSRDDDRLLTTFKVLIQNFAPNVIVEPGIIIDTTSGKFATFGQHTKTQEWKMPEKVEGEHGLKVYNFDKSVFEPDYKPEGLGVIQTSRNIYDIAAFVSAQRLGERGKINILCLNQAGGAIGNFFSDLSSLEKREDGARLANEAIRYAGSCGATAVVVYGSGIPDRRKPYGPGAEAALNEYRARTKMADITPIEVMSIDNDLNDYYSYADHGNWAYEPEQQYGDVRFREYTDRKEGESPRDFVKRSRDNYRKEFNEVAPIVILGEERLSKPEMKIRLGVPYDANINKFYGMYESLFGEDGKMNDVLGWSLNSLGINKTIIFAKESLLRERTVMTTMIHESVHAVISGWTPDERSKAAAAILKWADDKYGESAENNDIRRLYRRLQDNPISNEDNELIAHIVGFDIEKGNDRERVKEYASKVEGTEALFNEILNKIHKTNGHTEGNGGGNQPSGRSGEEASGEGGEVRFREVTPEMDAEYQKAVEDGDGKKIAKLVKDAFLARYPNTKVLDRWGNPRVVYHGTSSSEPFNIFDYDGDIFMSSSKGSAEQYTAKRGALGVLPGKHGRIMPMFVNLENPYIIDAGRRNWDNLNVEWSSTPVDANRVAEHAKNRGYDGVIIQRVRDNMFNDDRGYADDIIAFDPAQVKSTGPKYETKKRDHYPWDTYDRIVSEIGPTYDDNGNLIPLSERFNPESDDIRFRESKITPEMDAEFEQAYREGDKEKAQRMVHSAFLAKYPNTEVKNTVYHGTWEEPFNVFKTSEWTTEKSGHSRIKGYFSSDKSYAENYGPARSFYLNITKMLNIPFYDKTLTDWKKWFEKQGVEGVEFDSSIQEESLKGADYGDGIKKYYPVELFDTSMGFNGDGNLTEMIEKAGYNGIHYPGDESAYMPFKESQIKSAEPFTFDDNGELIPLSERFNPESDDIRFRELKQAEAETDTNPTEGQKEAGNYRKGHIRLFGMDLSIENPEGSVRSGVDASGKEWEQEMNNTYGYIRGTMGRDKDHIDFFLGPNLDSDKVYVIDQKDTRSGKFDEHKVMLGFDDIEDARNAYNSNYEEGWDGLGAITEMSLDDFKEWAFQEGRRVQPVSDVRFRVRDEKEYERIEKALGTAAVRYERAMDDTGKRLTEVMQDSMKSVDELQKALSEADGKPIRDYENAYWAAIQYSSRNKAMQENYHKYFFRPLMEEVAGLIKGEDDQEAALDELTAYLLAKHGLERNEVFARRDAKKEFDEYITQHPHGTATEDDFYIQNRKKDYSGLTALMKEKNVAAAEGLAITLVDSYERNHDTKALWDRINAATKETLRTSYNGGLISEDKYKELATMFQNYVPLRGFDETTSDDVYGYYGTVNSPYNTAIKAAKGRRSLADSPLATIANIADSEIMAANRNRINMAALALAEGHKNPLMSVSEVMYMRNPQTKMWEIALPQLSENDSPEEVAQKMSQFRQWFTQQMMSDPDNYRTQKELERVPYKVISKAALSEHQVLATRAGKHYIITINGNPRAAQALTGKTNADSNLMLPQVVSALSRWISRTRTQWNVGFVMRNLCRDAIFANINVRVTESPFYANKYNKNWGKVAVNMASLLHKYNNGTLDDNEPMERSFKEFIDNGGETGYTKLLSVKDYKKAMAKEIKKLTQSQASPKAIGEKILETVGGAVENMNRWAEGITRFAAYLTSREQGRSVTRSVEDAKEISVNFNKKGAGTAALTDKDKEDKAVAITAAASQIGREGYSFFNANIQGLAKFIGAIYNNPKAGSALLSGLLLAGVVMAMMNGGDGDDDEEKEYYNLPEYIRRSCLCIKAGKHWLTLPLPPEYTALYGLGELLHSAMSGNEYYEPDELAYEVLSQFSQLLPLDLLEGRGSGAWQNFVPTGLRTIVENRTNLNWMGQPIYNESVFNENDPEWRKAFRGTSPALVNMARKLSDWTGGNVGKAGKVNINPAKWEHFFEGYFGGIFSEPEKAIKAIRAMAGDEEMQDVRNYPIISGFMRDTSNIAEVKAENSRWHKIDDFVEKLLNEDRRLRQMVAEKAITGYDYDDEAVRDAELRLEELRSSEDWDFAQRWQAMQKARDKARQGNAEEEFNSLTKQMNEMYKEFRKRERK